MIRIRGGDSADAPAIEALYERNETPVVFTDPKDNRFLVAHIRGRLVGVAVLRIIDGLSGSYGVIVEFVVEDGMNQVRIELADACHDWFREHCIVLIVGTPDAPDALSERVITFVPETSEIIQGAPRNAAQAAKLRLPLREGVWGYSPIRARPSRERLRIPPTSGLRRHHLRRLILRFLRQRIRRIGEL